MKAWGMEHGDKARKGSTAGSGQVMSHLPSASLGHYASLSFVVIGKGQRTEFRIEDLGFGLRPRISSRRELVLSEAKDNKLTATFSSTTHIG